MTTSPTGGSVERDRFVAEVIETYDAMRERAKRAGKRRAADQMAWAKEATIMLMDQDARDRIREGWTAVLGSQSGRCQ